MIRTAEQLEHTCVSIRSALPNTSDIKFLDHLQKKFSNQVGFLPTQALEWNIENGKVSIALENDEPAAYLLGKGNYMHDPHFGIIYQAAVSYDARRRLMGTALVQHFMDIMAPGIRLIGLWCAQDIEANEFWNACGFEAIAARHGSRRKGRVHIFWVGRTAKGRHEQLRYPKYTKGGLMREHREVYGLRAGEVWSDVELPEMEETSPQVHRSTSPQGRTRKPKAAPGKCRQPTADSRQPSLSAIQRAFRYGQGNHICVVIAGATRYLPVAPIEMPNFTDLARVMIPRPRNCPRSGSVAGEGPAKVVRSAGGVGGVGGAGGVGGVGGVGGLWTPAGVDSTEKKAA